jgi:sarcosine oxidase gamma subunit
MTGTAIQLDHLGVLPRLALKGPEVARWLRDQTVAVPRDILSVIPIAGDARIARLGPAEFLIEASPGSDLVSRLRSSLSPLSSGIFLAARCDATFVLSGSDARSVLAQTCGIDFRVPLSDRVVFSRVAGVSCGILPEVLDTAIAYRLWVELSYSAYLWDTLADIVTELGGITRALAVALSKHQIGERTNHVVS